MDEERLYDKNVSSEDKEKNIFKADAEDSGAERALISEAVAATGEDFADAASEMGNSDKKRPRVAARDKKPNRIAQAKKRKRGESEPDTDRDRLVCAIASCVALAAAFAFAVVLALSLGNMADMLRGLSDAALWIGTVANLMLTFGLGVGAIVLSAIAHIFARRAHKGAEKRWREPTFILMVLPGLIALGVIVMLAVSVALAV